jgi:hypothetical protein
MGGYDAARDFVAPRDCACCIGARGQHSGCPDIKLVGEFQGPMMPEFENVLPKAYAARIQRRGIVNAGGNLASAAAYRHT